MVTRGKKRLVIQPSDVDNQNNGFIKLTNQPFRENISHRYMFLLKTLGGNKKPFQAVRSKNLHLDYSGLYHYFF